MQLVARALAERGTSSRPEIVRLADLPSYRSAFVTTSLGWCGGMAAVSILLGTVLFRRRTA